MLRACPLLCAAALCGVPAAARAQERPRTIGPAHHERCAAQWAAEAELNVIDLRPLQRAIQTAFAALSPHAGMLARVDGTVRALLMMPISVPIGPVGPTRTLHALDECHRETESFRPFRLSLEPGLLLHKPATGFVRLSFRSIWHPRASFFGLGAGFGAIADWQGSRALGFSSELLLQFGACCEPPFWQLSVRRDQYPSEREREAFVFVFGPTVW